MTVGLGRGRLRHEGKKLLLKQQVHQFRRKQAEVVFKAGDRPFVVQPRPAAQFDNAVLQHRHFRGSTRIPQAAIDLDATGLAIDRQQFIRELPILGILGITQAEFDRLAEQMSPAFLRPGEVRIHGGIVADQDARKGVRIEDHPQGLGVFMNSEPDDSGFLREKGPDAVDAPTGFVGMDDRRIGHEQAEPVELLFPIAGQLTQHGIRLRFLQRQVLQKLEDGTDFVERQADDLDQIGDGYDNLQTEFAAAQNAGYLAILTARTAINFVGDQHGATLFHTPNRSRVRELTSARIDAFGVNFLDALGFGQLFRRGQAAPPTFWLLWAYFLAARLLPLFFGMDGKGLIDLGSAGIPQLFLKILDTLLGRLELLLGRLELLLGRLELLLGRLELLLKAHDPIDEAFSRDSSVSDIFSELVDGIHATTNLPNPAELWYTNFQRLDSYLAHRLI